MTFHQIGDLYDVLTFRWMAIMRTTVRICSRFPPDRLATISLYTNGVMKPKASFRVAVREGTFF